jgi:hypothetical protein
VEAAESFYIYQHMINLHCFGSGFYDHAYPPREAKLERASSHSARREVGFEDVVERTPILDDVRIEPVCEKYPWWRLGDLAEIADNFDFVTSNATLREFNIEALTQYLGIISNSLKPDGLFIAQCTGHPANGNLEQLFERLKARSFAPLLFVDTSSPVKCDPDIRPGLISRIAGSLGNAPEARTFARQNLAYVKKGHPLFDKYISTPNVCRGEQCDGFVAPEPLVKKMFFDRPGGRKKYSAMDLIDLTKKRLVRSEETKSVRAMSSG